MKIAIHHRKNSFSDRWIDYCKKQDISYKIVNVYKNDIIKQLSDCNALMWHHVHSDPKDILFAKQLLFALEQKKYPIFPDFNTAWHFDDKLGQKYLLEAFDIPTVPSYAFFTKESALKWVDATDFPKVFKLRGGAGSHNVKLCKNKFAATKLINRAFGKGFKQYRPISNLKERWRQYRLGMTNFYDVVKGILRFFNEPEFSKIIGYEKGYIYFQDFIPNNKFDIRVIVINKRAYALKRMVRKGDFKASGSGSFKVEKNEFDERCIAVSFESAKKLKAQCLAFDFVFNEQNEPIIVELSYGFSINAYDACPGYWDDELRWYEGFFNPQEWMVDGLVEQIGGVDA